MKIKIAILSMLVLILLTGCESKSKSIESVKPMETKLETIVAKETTPIVSQIPTKESQTAISFEISPISVNHEVTDKSFFNESYRSEGTITVKGSELEIKKPFLVLIKVTQINKNNGSFGYGTGYSNIIVADGWLGHSDLHYDPDRLNGDSRLKPTKKRSLTTI